MTTGAKTDSGREDAPLPPLHVLHTALRRTTELLATELAQPTEIGPDWSDLEWRIAVAVAAIHGVSPLLSTRLRWQGPANWQQFIHEQRAHTMSRHRRIQELLASIDEHARHADIPVLALKGSALHAIGLYAPGERPMADLDLLVRDLDTPRTAQLLGDLGFVQSEVYWKHLTFTRRDARPAHYLGEHSGNDMKIELHARISEILPSRMTDVTRLIFPQHAQPGLNAYPSTAALMTHLLLHAAGAMAYRSFRLLNLHDIALLCGRMTDDDWNGVLRPDGPSPNPWWALPPLMLTAHYYPAVVPARIPAALAPNCPWWLRRLARRRTLSDVSLSYLWLEAFPGLAWAPSASEMLEHVVLRVRRAAQLLSQRKTPSADGSTGPAAGTLAKFSRTPYILRWLVSRPARPETLDPIRAVLGADAGRRGL